MTVIKNLDGTMSVVSTSVSNPLAKTKLPKTSVTNADGSTSLAKGTEVKENPDGTVTVDGVVLPTGTGLKKLPDGSYVIFTMPKLKPLDKSVKLPKSAVTNLDGTTVLKVGTVVKENQDGTIVVDGVLMPKGTGIRKMPDGSMVLYSMPTLRKVAPKPMPAIKTNLDGTVSLGNVKLPPGVKPGPDGALALPKEAKVTKNPDGTVSVDGKPLPPGIGTKVNPDGTISLAPATSLPPPLPLQTSPDGSITVGGVKMPPGVQPNLDGSIGLPKGAKVSKSKDGSVTIDGQKLPPGTSIQTNANGSMSIVSSLPPPSGIRTSPDGSVILGNIALPKGAKPAFDGSISLQKGTVVAKTINGCVSINGKELPSGTQIRTNPDGSLSILPPSMTGLVTTIGWLENLTVYFYFRLWSSEYFEPHL